MANDYQSTPTENQAALLKSLGLKAETQQQARKVLSNVLSDKPLNYHQKIRLLSLLSSIGRNEICQILKREVSNINEISVAEYQKIMAVVTRPDQVFLKSINHPITINETYEYGWQESPLCVDGKLYYLLSYDMMMIDIDVEMDINILRELPFTFRVYKTYEGYHLFITSEYIHYRDPKVKQIVSYLKGDIYYRLYSQRFGFKVRLNSKIGRNEQIAATYIRKIGDTHEIPSILEYLKLHDNLIEKHCAIQQGL